MSTKPDLNYTGSCNCTDSMQHKCRVSTQDHLSLHCAKSKSYSVNIFVSMPHPSSSALTSDLQTNNKLRTVLLAWWSCTQDHPSVHCAKCKSHAVNIFVSMPHPSTSELTSDLQANNKLQTINYRQFCFESYYLSCHLSYPYFTVRSTQYFLRKNASSNCITHSQVGSSFACL